MNLDAIQEALRHNGVDGWLFYDHHRRDPLAYRILGLPSGLNPTRRWFYFIPSQGEPRALAHRIEPHSLNSLPGTRRHYSRWAELSDEITALIAGSRRVAMQYSPNNAVPYVGMVDSGTVEFVRSFGVEVVTSADLVQLFEARWSDAQLEMHLEAGRRMDRIRAAAFDLIRERLASRTPVTEWEVHQFLHEQFRASSLYTDHGPIVAVNGNASNPHYEPTHAQHAPIGPGDLVLIDMWSKLDREDAVYYDITWTGYCGPTPPDEIQTVFRTVTGARDRAIETVVERAASGLQGFEVDDAARSFIREQGFANYFIHRTGHSIGTEVHGAGANMDNFETHDVRRVIPRTCFSVEPGVYLPEFGVRSEVNMYIGDDKPFVTGEIQRELVILG
jgi:Xaa-Pro dipeptidase